MRPLSAIAAAVFILAGVQPGAAAPRGIAATVLIVTDVGETAQYMPAALWRKLAAEYVNARNVTVEDGTALPDEASCRSAHALYAVLARFDRATRLPGLAQGTDRTYGVARFTVRNCLTGTVSPVKMLNLESDPLSEPERGEFSPNAEQIWDRSVRAAAVRDPLVLNTVARIVRVENNVVVLDSSGGFSVNQVLRVFADANAKPYAVPIELVVVEVSGKYTQATIVGKGTPRAGDYVEAQK